MLHAVVSDTNVINRLDTELNDDPLYRAAATANVEGALTYMSWPEYEDVLSNNQANIQLVAVGSDCVLPSAETIADGSYSITRPGQLIVNQAALARTEVMSFLWYLLSDENIQYLEDAGFIGVTFADLAEARNTLQSVYTESLTAASQPEATAEPGTEVTAEATPEATAEATEASGG
jgi:hypothetical protein